MFRMGRYFPDPGKGKWKGSHPGCHSLPMRSLGYDKGTPGFCTSAEDKEVIHPQYFVSHAYVYGQLYWSVQWGKDSKKQCDANNITSETETSPNLTERRMS